MENFFKHLKVLLSAYAMKSPFCQFWRWSWRVSGRRWASTTCPRTVKTAYFSFFSCVNGHCNFDHSFISHLKFQCWFFFPQISYACPASVYYKSFKIIELWNQNQILQKHQILQATHIIKLYFQQSRFFYFSLKLHFFTTKRLTDQRSQTDVWKWYKVQAIGRLYG